MFIGKKPSDVIQAYLDWLTEMKAEQERNWEIVTREDGGKLTDLIHEMEFKDGDADLLEVAKRFHDSRIERRIAKDRAKSLKPIKDYMDDATCKAHIKRLTRLVKDLQAAEQFYEGDDRIYKPRSADKAEEKRTDQIVDYEDAKETPGDYVEVLDLNVAGEYRVYADESGGSDEHDGPDSESTVPTE